MTRHAAVCMWRHSSLAHEELKSLPYSAMYCRMTVNNILYSVLEQLVECRWTGTAQCVLSYVPDPLYAPTYPVFWAVSVRPDAPLPLPLSSKRSLWLPVYLLVSVRRSTPPACDAAWTSSRYPHNTVSRYSRDGRRRLLSLPPVHQVMKTVTDI